jgi:dynein light chain LC8-type
MSENKQKISVKSVDMTEGMQQEAIQISIQALESFTVERDVASHIKKEFDKLHSPTWHCIVGRSFGSYVTHETKHFIYFYINTTAILLFKAG